MAHQGLSRRDMLLMSGTATLTTAMGHGCKAQRVDAADRPMRSSKPPRHVIFMVSDGMSMGVPTLAEPFARKRSQGKRGTAWHTLLHNDPTAVHGLLATDSLSSMVTDSSAAASAWASGSRVVNGTLNVLPDGTALTPITTLLHERGVRTGLVTTDLMTGGTPAGFAAVHQDRNDHPALAPQYLDIVDVLMGGGRAFFQAANHPDNLDAIKLYRSHGYDYFADRATLMQRADAPADRDAPNKMLGLFADSKLPYTIDHIHDQQLRRTVPTLAEMMAVAIRAMIHAPGGSFTMVEGARIDHAAHNNDAGAILHEQLAFDDAVDGALKLAAMRDDTLVVITSDHGNANPGLNGMGDHYNASTACFDRLLRFNASFDRMQQLLRQRVTGNEPIASATRRVVEQCTGIRIDDTRADQIGQAIIHEHMPEELALQQRNWVAALGQVIGNYTGIGWTGVSHTADHVLLTARGPGAEAFAGLHHHTEVFRIITGFFGLNHANPTADRTDNAAAAPALDVAIAT